MVAVAGARFGRYRKVGRALDLHAVPRGVIRPHEASRTGMSIFTREPGVWSLALAHAAPPAHALQRSAGRGAAGPPASFALAPDAALPDSQEACADFAARVEAARVQEEDDAVARAAARVAASSCARLCAEVVVGVDGVRPVLIDEAPQAPLIQATAAAEALPADDAPGTAAQRRVRAAEDGLRVGLASLDGICLEESSCCRVLTLQSVPSRLRGALSGPASCLFRMSFGAGSFSSLLHVCFSTVTRGKHAYHPPICSGGCYSTQAASPSKAPDLTARAGRATAPVHRASSPQPPARLSPTRSLRGPMPPSPSFAIRHDAPLNPIRPDVARHRRVSARSHACGRRDAEQRQARREPRELKGAAQRHAHADVPAPALAAMQVERIVALQNPKGRGLRALVVGDVLRRLVGRTLAQAFAPHFEQACLPHQYMASARVPAVRPCHASSARLPRSMPVLQSFPSMQLAPSTMPPARPCSAPSSPTRNCARSSLLNLPANSMAPPALTSGLTDKASRTMSHRSRAGNKATP